MMGAPVLANAVCDCCGERCQKPELGSSILLIGTPGLEIGDFIIGGPSGKEHGDVKKLQ
jgi:hypothetical protein